ncbi:uncharacterized protein LOC132049630 [Lycium ferocissimum]|uniref:uncharacterized protein LOC132049630 n=1 Tax=Lycium ferocissimum TaxID=112874 RepID=UPI002815CDC3|nr:uncharacterized protein LOC132049630 [Lycium ferocissimum]
MAKTSKNDGGSVNCFSGNILRRILCSGSLPTHPCDQFIISEPKIVQFDHSSDDQKVVNSSPGLVARLMGLESIPVQRTFGSFLRSRSVSSLETYMPQLDLAEKFHHRRVRTSVSFREILTFDQEKPEPEKSCNCRKLDVCRKQNVRNQRNKSIRIVSNRVKPLFNSEDSRSKHIQAATPGKFS